MSGGQQQRVAIARALVGERTLVLADEPTGALDSETGESVLRLLRDRCDAGAAGVLVTHEARHAGWADRVVFLRDGLVVDETGRAAARRVAARTAPRERSVPGASASASPRVRRGGRRAAPLLIAAMVGAADHRARRRRHALPHGRALAGAAGRTRVRSRPTSSRRTTDGVGVGELRGADERSAIDAAEDRATWLRVGARDRRDRRRRSTHGLHRRSSRRSSGRRGRRGRASSTWRARCSTARSCAAPDALPSAPDEVVVTPGVARRPPARRSATRSTFGAARQVRDRRHRGRSRRRARGRLRRVRAAEQRARGRARRCRRDELSLVSVRRRRRLDGREIAARCRAAGWRSRASTSRSRTRRDQRRAAGASTPDEIGTAVVVVGPRRCCRSSCSRAPRSPSARVGSGATSGLIAAQGGDRRQVRSVVLASALVIGAAASVVGVALGVAARRGRCARRSRRGQRAVRPVRGRAAAISR